MDAPRPAGYPQPVPGPAHRHRWVGDICAAWALASGVAVIVLALLLPIQSVDDGRAGTQPMSSLYQVNGPLVLLPAAAPLAVAVLVSLLLYAGRHGDRRWTLPVAWTLSGVLLCAAVVGFVTFLIGVFVIPTGALLLAATQLAQSTRRRATTPGAVARPVPHPQ
jgi:hypothetical protein